ncbi:MAG: transglutaminase-like domain-containing protein [Candidatus Diapherotrites archaeon]
MAKSLPFEALRKTSAEQSLLRTLEALQSELSENVSFDRKIELEEQIALLKQQLSHVSSPSIELLVERNTELKNNCSLLESELDDVKQKYSELRKRYGSISAIGPSEEDHSVKFRLYRILLEKYTGLINESEKKTVGELKALVDGQDLSVQSLVNDFKPENYSFEKNFLQSAEQVFDFIVSNISFVDAELEINFWLSPSEILTEKLGDDEDLSVLLCSCLMALGDRKAEVIIAELDNLSTHAVVSTELGGKFFLLDPSQKKPFNEFSGEKKDVLKKYSFRGAKIKRFLYKFNRDSYEQFIE